MTPGWPGPGPRSPTIDAATTKAPAESTRPRIALPAALSDARVLTALVLIAIAVGAWLRWEGMKLGGDQGDVFAYRNHIELIKGGQNPYTSEGLYPYFAGWMNVEWLAWLLSLSSGRDFWFVIRIFIIAADLGTAFALWWATTRAGGAGRGRWAAVLYALSPIAILISGNHGQFDGFPTLCAVIGAGLLYNRHRVTDSSEIGEPVEVGRRIWIATIAAGLLLGLAISLKPFPALLVPIFMRAPRLSLLQRAVIPILAGAVVFGISAPFILADVGAMAKHIGGYGGLPDQTMGGLMRSLWLIKADNIYLPGEFGKTYSADTRFFALAVIAFAYFATWREPIARTAAAVLTGFLFAFGGVSSQYLVWPLAWLLLSDVALFWPVLYGIGTSFGAVGFYLVYWPQFVLGPPWRGPMPEFDQHFVIGQAVSFLTVTVVFGATLAGGFRRSGWWKNPFLWVALAAVFFTGYKVYLNLSWFITEWLKYMPVP